MLGGLLSRLAGSFGFGGGGNQPPQAKYGGNTTTMGQLRDVAPQDYVKYGGDTTTMGQLRDPIMNQQMNTQMPDMSGPQMNPQMNTQIGGAMGNNQGYGDLMGGQGGFSNKMPNQGYDDLMGGQGGFANNPFAKLGSDYQSPSWGGKDGYQASPGMMDPRNDGLAAHYKSLADANNQKAISRGPGVAGNAPGGGGQQLSGAYAAPSWGGGQQGPLQMPGGVRDRSTMFDPRLGGKGGFSWDKSAGMGSNLGNIAKRFKPMSKGGYSIGEMFKPGGMTNTLLGKGGKVGAAISSAPAWAMPAAGAAAFGVKHIMKRSKQKKHQKQQNAQRDQIKNAASNGQYVTGNLGSLSGPRNY